MKKSFVFFGFIIVFLAKVSFAQLQNANWCFGIDAKVGFMTTPPSVSTSSITTNSTFGGYDVGSVSDQNGNLLFYTNGKVVWGKNNVIMPNGSQLYTTESGWTTQFLSIVAKPNSPNLYYLFQLACGFGNPHTLGHEGIYYSVIDMNLNNGNGDIVAGRKNIPLKNDLGQVIDYNYNTGVGLKPKFGEITSALHRDGDKVWVSFLLTFDNANVPARYLYSYLVTENGIHNSPDALSHVPDGNTLLSNANYISQTIVPFSYGQIKISPDGSYLCDAMYEAVNLYKFNNQTGTVIFNTQLYLDDGNGNGSGIGVEFSPNSQLLYFSTYVYIYQQAKIIKPVQKRQVRIFQNKIGSRAIEVIHKMDILESPQSTEASLDSFPPGYNTFGLQRAIDGKIYFCSTYPAPSPPNQTQRILGAIRQPNLLSTACDVSLNELTLLAGTRFVGTLPQWVHKAIIKWPKVYNCGYPQLLKDNFGNIFSYFYGAGNLYQNINHNGVLPLFSGNPQSSYYTFQYNSNAFTNWTKSDLLPLYVLNSGNIQLGTTTSYPFITSYINGTTGLSTNGPSLVPPNECIIAETTNGGFITLNNTNIFYHSPSGFNATINANVVFMQYKFNPLTNRLFINDVNGTFKVYDIINNNFVLVSSSPLYTHLQIIQISNQDKVYVYNTSGLQEYNYLSNTLIPVTISGFNSSNVFPMWSNSTYTGNKALVHQTQFINPNGQSGLKFYALDFATNTSKNIDAFGGFHIESFTYVFEGDNVYVATAFSGISSIGNQTLPILNPQYSAFIAKLNLQTDFSLRAPSMNTENSFSKKTTTIEENVTTSNTNRQLNVYLKKLDSDVDVMKNTNVSSIQVYNQVGQLMNVINTQQAINNLINNNKVSATSIVAGIYFLRITYKDNTTETIKRFLN
jgi:hypothetical protein